MTTLSETPEIMSARAEFDLERAKYRARAMINFIEVRATDITASLRLEEWVKDAISELTS
jgi:hypothetical protein